MYKIYIVMLYSYIIVHNMVSAMLVLKQDLEDRVNVQEKDPLQSIMDHSTLIIMLIMVLFTNFIQST